MCVECHARAPLHGCTVPCSTEEPLRSGRTGRHVDHWPKPNVDTPVVTRTCYCACVWRAHVRADASVLPFAMSLESQLRLTLERLVTLPLECVFYMLSAIESVLAEVLLSAGRPTPSQCAVRSSSMQSRMPDMQNETYMYMHAHQGGRRLMPQCALLLVHYARGPQNQWEPRCGRQLHRHRNRYVGQGGGCG